MNSKQQKIIVVSPPTFGNAVGGAAKDIFEMVTLLKNMGHDVSFYAIGTLGQDKAVIEAFQKKYSIPTFVYMPSLGRTWHWLRAVVSDFGYIDRAAYVFLQLTEDASFQRYIAETKPDTIVHFCSYSWPVARFAREKKIPTVFRSHNFEPGFFWEALDPLSAFNPINWIRYIAKRRGEWNAVRYTSAVATIPFEDAWRYEKWKPGKIFRLTLTYLPEALRPPHVHKDKRPLDVFYLGASYRVSFHLRGARVLIEDIAPRVLARAPGAFRFHICGAKLPKYLAEKCDNENIIYEGYVPDLEAFLQKMDIGAFPVFTGKSMKGKVFESLARGFPIVIPENCLGGYALKHEREVLLAETEGDFIASIIALSDVIRREHLALNASQFAEKLFSSRSLQGILQQSLDAARSIA